MEKYKLDAHKYMWGKADENKGEHIESIQSSKNVENTCGGESQLKIYKLLVKERK